MKKLTIHTLPGIEKKYQEALLKDFAKWYNKMMSKEGALNPYYTIENDVIDMFLERKK